jgi:hypothetical protein
MRIRRKSAFFRHTSLTFPPSSPPSLPPSLPLSHPQALDIELLHEIPIRVMRAADIQYYTPPDVPVPRVQLELPYNRSMRTVLEVFIITPPFLLPSLPPSFFLTLK